MKEFTERVILDSADKYGRYISLEDVERVNAFFEEEEKRERAIQELAACRMRNEFNYKLKYIGEGKYQTENGFIL